MMTCLILCALLRIKTSPVILPGMKCRRILFRNQNYLNPQCCLFPLTALITNQLTLPNSQNHLPLHLHQDISWQGDLKSNKLCCSQKSSDVCFSLVDMKCL